MHTLLITIAAAVAVVAVLLALAFVVVFVAGVFLALRDAFGSAPAPAAPAAVEVAP